MGIAQKVIRARALEISVIAIIIRKVRGDLMGAGQERT